LKNNFFSLASRPGLEVKKKSPKRSERPDEGTQIFKKVGRFKRDSFAGAFDAVGRKAVWANARGDGSAGDP